MSEPSLRRLQTLLKSAAEQLQSLQRHVDGMEEVPVSYPSIELIQRVVGERFQISRQAMASPRRWYKATHARHIAMYLAREMTAKSFAQIGRMFGNRDHTSVMHAARKKEQEIKLDLVLAAEVNQIKMLIEKRHANQKNGSHVPPDTGEPLGQGIPLSDGAAVEPNRQATAAASPIQGGA